MLASQLNSASSIAGENTALYVVCAVVVGGTSVAGGVGGAIKSAIGLLLLGLLTNAFNMLRIDSYVSYLPTALLGIIIVSILWLDSYSAEAKAGSRLGRDGRATSLDLIAVDARTALEPVIPAESRARSVTSVHLSATRRGYAADPTPSTVNTITHPVPSDHWTRPRTNHRRSRRDLVHEMPAPPAQRGAVAPTRRRAEVARNARRSRRK